MPSTDARARALNGWHYSPNATHCHAPALSLFRRFPSKYGNRQSPKNYILLSTAFFEIVEIFDEFNYLLKENIQLCKIVYYVIDILKLLWTPFILEIQ